jgi:hypothetical protein
LHEAPALVENVKRMPGVSSVQITFREEWAPDRHAMPPGSFRLAIINGFDLADAFRRAPSGGYFSATVTQRTAMEAPEFARYSCGAARVGVGSSRPLGTVDSWWSPGSWWMRI